MGDLLEAILQPIADLLGLGDADDGGLVLPGGGPLWATILTVVSLVGAFLLWLWLG